MAQSRTKRTWTTGGVSPSLVAPGRGSVQTARDAAIGANKKPASRRGRVQPRSIGPGGRVDQSTQLDRAKLRRCRGRKSTGRCGQVPTTPASCNRSFAGARAICCALFLLCSDSALGRVTDTCRVTTDAPCRARKSPAEPVAATARTSPRHGPRLRDACVSKTWRSAYRSPARGAFGLRSPSWRTVPARLRPAFGDLPVRLTARRICSNRASPCPECITQTGHTGLKMPPAAARQYGKQPNHRRGTGPARPC